MKFKCPCCGCLTFEGDIWADLLGEICPVCFWEIDGVSGDMQSGANHGLTVSEGRKNYIKYGACKASLVKYVRESKACERNN